MVLVKRLFVGIKVIHQVKIIPAITVAPFRQVYKTDKNDALAVAEAANRSNIRSARQRPIIFATLGSGETFKNGREFSAYIGLTPKQYSAGGKTNFIGILRHVANRRLRAVLIHGARSCVDKRKQAASAKDAWLLELLTHGGTGKAALANNNVWAPGRC